MKLNYQSASGRSANVNFRLLAPLVATIAMGCAAQKPHITTAPATAQIVVRSSEPSSKGNLKSAASIYEQDAAIAEQNGDYEKAALLYRRAAGYYTVSHDRENARKCYTKASSLHRETISTLIKRGLGFEKSGKPVEAAAAFAHAADLRQAIPGNDGTHIELVQKAIRIVESAISDMHFASFLPELYTLGGDLYAKLGDHEKERRMYMKAFSANVKIALATRRSLRYSQSAEQYQAIRDAYDRAASALDKVAANYERIDRIASAEEFRAYAVEYHGKAIEIARSPEATKVSRL